MKKVECALSTLLPIMALTAVLYFTSQPILAQSSPDSSRNTASQTTADARRPEYGERAFSEDV